MKSFQFSILIITKHNIRKCNAFRKKLKYPLSNNTIWRKDRETIWRNELSFLFWSCTEILHPPNKCCLSNWSNSSLNLISVSGTPVTTIVQVGLFRADRTHIKMLTEGFQLISLVKMVGRLDSKDNYYFCKIKSYDFSYTTLATEPRDASDFNLRN